MVRGAFRVDCNISSSTVGLLMEAGASSRSAALYCVGGNLYFQAGAGVATADGASDECFISWPIPTSSADYVIEWSADAPDGDARLWVDGVLVGSDSTGWTNDRISGANPGKIGGVGGGNVRNTVPGGNVTLSGGTISFAMAWANMEVPA